MPPVSWSRRLSNQFRWHRRRSWAVVIGLGLLVSYPFWAGALAAKVITDQGSAKLGVPVSIDRCLAGLGVLYIHGLSVGEPGKPKLATVEDLRIPFAAAWGSGTVVVEKPQIEVH